MGDMKTLIDSGFRNAAFVAAAGILFASSEGFAQTPSQVDFNAQILPILSKTCFPCHGPDDKSRAAGLRLDQKIENPGVIVPGDAATSRLIRRIVSTDPEERMPPADAKRQLTGGEIELLQQWVSEGAVWSEHWAFSPPGKWRSPEVRETGWLRNAVDDFVLAKLEQQNLRPSPEAAKETLLRRVTLDLIGLLPTLDEREEFLADDRPDVYERLVDRLLASPHYGERWGRHWLDGARYADSSGFETDAPRTVWKYRDWVLRAVNQDLPFDEFLIKQLAGDLLPNASTEDRIATGFLLNSQQDGGSEPARLDAVVDRVNTLGSVLLGLTLGCAQCHSHKFDPVTQKEYYALFAFVNSADELKLEFAPADEIARRDALQAQLEALTAERTAYAAKFPAKTVKDDPGYQARTITIEQLTAKIPKFESALVMKPGPEQRVTTTYVRGEYAHPGEMVSPGVPAVLPPMREGTRTRLELARWLVSPQQPLTPRVTVNRAWQQFFGRGLVETESDFGTQGARPTHPELLDRLAHEFSHQGWGVKRLNRLIVQSATYRQTSQRRVDLDAIDPGNRWLARQARLRLEAEAVRDAALTAGGLLSTKMFGPSVFPYQQDGIMLNRATPAQWMISPGEDRYRRGLYTHYWRLTPHPQLQTFDAPDAITACTRRLPSNTPLQALTLLNDPTFTEGAEALARRLADHHGADEAKLSFVMSICLSRAPTEEECGLLMGLLSEARIRFASTAAGELAAWTQVARTLINLEEFIVRE